MSDYIKREDVLKTLKDLCNDKFTLMDWYEYYIKSLIDVEDKVKQIPSADVVEVKHGKWILEYEPNGKPYCFHCSVCDGDFHYIDITTAYPFCPHCGAEMRGAE